MFLTHGATCLWRKAVEKRDVWHFERNLCFRGVLIVITDKFKFLLDMVKLFLMLKSGAFKKAEKTYFRLLLHTLLKNVFFVYLLQDLIKLRLIPNVDTLCPTHVTSVDRCKKGIQKQLYYYFIIFCCSWDALHVPSKSHNKKWPLSSKMHVLNLFTLSSPLLQYYKIFFNLSLLKFLGRVALPYSLCNRLMRNQLSLIWKCMSMIRTGGSLYGHL